MLNRQAGGERAEVDAWSVRRILAWMQADFERRGIESARLDADLLVAHALELKRIALYLDLDRPLIEPELTKIRALVERRRAREPIAYILGAREFYGRSFALTRDVLIPRPDTETLVEAALALLRSELPPGPVLDLCTGSGAIAVTLAAELPERELVASDLSQAALDVARENALHHGVAARVALRVGDLFAALAQGERFACITANPPYVARAELASLAPEIRAFEPRLALDAGDDPLRFYRQIAAGVGRHLARGAALLVEVGSGQAGEVARLFAAHGLARVHARRDLSGIERVVCARSE